MARDEYDDRDRDDRRDDRDERDRDDRDRYDDDAEDIRAASKKVKPPAICLLIAGIVSLLFVGWGVYQFINFDKEFDAEIERSQQQQGGDPKQQEAVKEMMGTVKNVMKVAMPIGLGVQTLTALIMIFGSTRVLSLSSRGWGTAAAAMSFIPHLSCLPWLVGLAFGIWMLVTLGSKEVRRGFAAKARSGSGGGGYDDRDDRR